MMKVAQTMNKEIYNARLEKSFITRLLHAAEVIPTLIIGLIALCLEDAVGSQRKISSRFYSLP
jgi:hypothetical protein